MQVVCQRVTAVEYYCWELDPGSLPPGFMPGRDCQSFGDTVEFPLKDTRTKGEKLPGGRFGACQKLRVHIARAELAALRSSCPG